MRVRDRRLSRLVREALEASLHGGDSGTSLHVTVVAAGGSMLVGNAVSCSSSPARNWGEVLMAAAEESKRGVCVDCR